MTAKLVFRRLSRIARWLLVVAIKFLFVCWLIAVEPIVNLIRLFATFVIDQLIEWPGVRSAVARITRSLESFDGWLRARSTTFVFSIIGTLVVIGIGLFFYKTWLLTHAEGRMLLYVEVGEKCSYGLILKHLLYVYHERLMAYRVARLAYERGMALRAAVVAWIASNRYSMITFAWNAAGRHQCCLLNRAV